MGKGHMGTPCEHTDATENVTSHNFVCERKKLYNFRKKEASGNDFIQPAEPDYSSVQRASHEPQQADYTSLQRENASYTEIM